MLFNSFQFLCFFVACWLLFLVLRGIPRKAFLLAASYYFYMCWSTKYIVVIWAITLIDFLAGLKIEKASRPSLRRFYLCFSLLCNLGLLFFFKYFNFVESSLNSLLHVAAIDANFPLLRVILPVGLSFHTFQAMSYTVDVYKRKAPAEHSLLNYALYVAFFPQMVAGPIERPNQLLPQFRGDPRLQGEQIGSGFVLALWGLFKKMVVADGVANFVTMVYAKPRMYPGSGLMLATLFFGIQIYCDFSGYTDIARGLARMMGYELRINFLQPYFSRSIGEFWRRWHISLSTWFRDYLYIPLGGNRVAVPRHYLNLLVTFVISGLWHGAAWTFIIWGTLHGFYLIFGQLTLGLRTKLRNISRIDKFPNLVHTLQIVVTQALVLTAWVFFRAERTQDALYILRHFLPLGHFYSAMLAMGGIPRANVPFLAFFICAMFSVEWFVAHPAHMPRFWSIGFCRKLCYQACAYSIVFFGVFGHVDFIYFQF